MSLRLFFVLTVGVVAIGVACLALFNALGLGALWRFGTILVTGCAVWFVFKLFSQLNGD